MDVSENGDADKSKEESDKDDSKTEDPVKKDDEEEDDEEPPCMIVTRAYKFRTLFEIEYYYFC